MKKSNLVSIGDAIAQLLKEEKLDVKLSRFAVRNGWADIAGELIARNTKQLHFNGPTLFITLTSDALRHELSFRRSQLVESVNRFCGQRLIDEIILK